jgi:hypothetical protein
MTAGGPARDSRRCSKPLPNNGSAAPVSPHPGSGNLRQIGGSRSWLMATVGNLCDHVLRVPVCLAAESGQADRGYGYRAAPAMNAATMYVACRSRLVRARS